MRGGRPPKEEGFVFVYVVVLPFLILEFNKMSVHGPLPPFFDAYIGAIHYFSLGYNLSPHFLGLRVCV